MGLLIIRQIQCDPIRNALIFRTQNGKVMIEWECEYEYQG